VIASGPSSAPYAYPTSRVHEANDPGAWHEFPRVGAGVSGELGLADTLEALVEQVSTPYERLVDPA
jgi:hypothetical protein